MARNRAGTTARTRARWSRSIDIGSCHCALASVSAVARRRLCAGRATGVEFFGFREYQYGDAVRRIDWVRSERLQKPIVRTTHDAHDMDIVLVVDRSVSTTTPYSNTDMASVITEVASIVVAALADIECALTVVPFADRVMRATHSHGNRDGIERHLAHLRAQQVATRYADLSLLIETVMRTTPRRSLIIILSAFDDDGYQQQLISLASRHHVCAILLYDSHALDGMRVGRYCAYIDRAHAPRRSYSRCTGALRHELERRDRDARHAWHDSARHHGINALSVDIAQSPLEECVRALSA